MTTFRRWLENEEQVELQVAQFLEDILDRAVALQKQDMAGDQPPAMFSRYVQQVWPPDARQGHKFLLPSTFPQGVGGMPVDFKIMGDPSTRAYAFHDNGVFAGFVINIKPLRSTNIEEVDRYLVALKSAVHHEADHIFSPGAEYDDDSEDRDRQIQATLAYISNQGEIRAHAREMARAFATHFPGEEFDLAKAQTLLDQPYFNQTHRNYFQGLAKPGKWEELQTKYGGWQNPHLQAVQMVKSLLPQYQRR